MSESLPAKLDPSGEALLDEVTFGNGRGGRRQAEDISISVVRSLTPEDVPALQAKHATGGPGQKVIALRHSHHQTARLLAEGLENAEVSLITGYHPNYISGVLKNDPAFCELVEHYESQTKIRFVDLVERLRASGLSALDELNRRLEEETGSWSRRELMEFVELSLSKVVEPKTAPVGPAVAVAISFVQATPPAGVTIDAEPLT